MSRPTPDRKDEPFRRSSLDALGANGIRVFHEPAHFLEDSGASMEGRELSLKLSAELDRRIREEASRLDMSREQRVLELLEYGIAPARNLEPGFIPEALEELKQFLTRIPGIEVISLSDPNEARWWVKLRIDIDSTAAWHVVQGLGYVLNELSLTDRLPTTFKPVSPPPYLNGGPDEFLCWVIEANIPFFDPRVAISYLRERLPDPIADEEAWLNP